MFAGSTGIGFIPHVINVKAGEVGNLTLFFSFPPDKSIENGSFYLCFIKFSFEQFIN